MNNLYEFGDLCNVVIRCNSDRTIGGKKYLAGEPYTILEDVLVNLSYVTTNANVAAQNHIIAHREGLPDYVSISRVPLNAKVVNLIADNKQPHYISNYCYCEASEGGVIYLPHSCPIVNIWIYDSQHNRITDFIVQEDRIVGAFEKYQTYLVFYDYLSGGDCFVFDTPHYGYFTLEVFAKGNTNKTTEPLYMKFPAVSLMSIPVFDLVSGTILHAPLQWQIIHRGQEQSYFNIGD